MLLKEVRDSGYKSLINLFGGRGQSPCHIELGKDDLVIAVDGGFNYLEKIGLRADYVLGDFDSVSASSHLPSDASATQKKKMIRT